MARRAPPSPPSLSSEDVERLQCGVVTLRREDGEWVVEAHNSRYVSALPPEFGSGVVSLRIRDYLPPDFVPLAQEVLDEALRAGSAYRPADRLTYPGLGTRWYRWSAVAHSDETQCVTALVFDITESVEATATQRAERAAVIDHLRDAILMLDRDSTIQFANDAARRLLGPGLEGRNWSEVRHEVNFRREDGRPVGATVAQAMRGGHPAPMDVHLRSPVSGEEVICRAYASPVARDGEIDGVAVLLADVTEERRLLRERRVLLERQQTAREQVRAELATTLHDGLVQTLVELSFTLNLAEDGLQPLDAGTLRRIVDRALAESRGLLEDMQPPTLRHGVSRAVDELAADWRERGLLDVRVTGDPLPRMAAWRESLLYRVVVEMLRNILRHAQGPAEVHQKREAERVVLTITDQGPGISREDRAAAANSGHLGLLLSAERMAALGGSLDVDSTPGEGTTIVLHCPIE